jgi:hypothetical protein
MNKVVLALNAIAQNLSLLLDVAGSIDRRLAEQNKLLDEVAPRTPYDNSRYVRTWESNR